MPKRIGAVQAAAMLLAGILTGQYLRPSLLLSLSLFVISLAGGIFFYLKGRKYTLDQPPKKASRALICIALFFAGFVRIALMSSDRPAGSVENYADSDRVTFTGIAAAPPVTTTSRTTLRVEIDRKQELADGPDYGRVLLIFYSKPNEAYQYGDHLKVSGKLSLPPDTGSSFSYRSYLEREGITAVINNPKVERLSSGGGNLVISGIYRLRNLLLGRIYQLFPQPESALMAGILLGDESKITSEIDHAFQKTGTAHIIAISGANFTLLTWLLLSILRRIVHQWWAPVLMIPFIVFYTILVGGNSAVVRAAIMCSLSIIGMTIGRRGNGINNLALTSAVMGLVKPSFLSDLGFQLSVTATLGILLFSSPISNFMRMLLAKIFPKIEENTLSIIVAALNDLCILSVSAQIFTLWVSAQAFGRISLISLPANFLIAPFQSLIMLGGFAALLLSYVFYPLGIAAAWLIWPAPALTIRIVQRCADIKWGSVYFDLSALQAWMVIALILCAFLGRKRIINSIRTRNYHPYLMLLLIFAAVMVWVNALDRLDRRVKIEFSSASSSMTLNVCSSEKRIFVVADGLTNYAAQKLLETQIFPVRRIPEGAWIDIHEEWMSREFADSDAVGGLSFLYLNGNKLGNKYEIPEKLEPNESFSVDGIEFHVAAAYLGKRAWVVVSGNKSLLFPNGIPPERIFTRGGLPLSSADVITIGKRDNSILWHEFIEQQSVKPYLLDRSAAGNITFYISEDSIGYL